MTLNIVLSSIVKSVRGKGLLNAIVIEEKYDAWQVQVYIKHKGDIQWFSYYMDNTNTLRTCVYAA